MKSKKEITFHVFFSHIRAINTLLLCSRLAASPECLLIQSIGQRFSASLFCRFTSYGLRSTLTGPFSLNLMFTVRTDSGRRRQQTLRLSLPWTHLYRQLNAVTQVQESNMTTLSINEGWMVYGWRILSNPSSSLSLPLQAKALEEEKSYSFSHHLTFLPLSFCLFLTFLLSWKRAAVPLLAPNHNTNGALK